MQLSEAVEKIQNEYNHNDIEPVSHGISYCNGLEFALNILNQVEEPAPHMNAFQAGIINNSEPIDEFKFRTEVGEITATVYQNSNLSPLIMTSSTDSERLLKLFRAKSFEIFYADNMTKAIIFYTTTDGKKEAKPYDIINR